MKVSCDIRYFMRYPFLQERYPVDQLQFFVNGPKLRLRSHEARSALQPFFARHLRATARSHHLSIAAPPLQPKAPTPKRCPQQRAQLYAGILQLAGKNALLVWGSNVAHYDGKMAFRCRSHSLRGTFGGRQLSLGSRQRKRWTATQLLTPVWYCPDFSLSNVYATFLLLLRAFTFNNRFLESLKNTIPHALHALEAGLSKQDVFQPRDFGVGEAR